MLRIRNGIGCATGLGGVREAATDLAFIRSESAVARRIRAAKVTIMILGKWKISMNVVERAI
jgi:hypothetical protein